MAQMRPTGPRGRVLIVGCNGGVGSAVLSVLCATGPGRRMLASIEHLLLLDALPVAPDVPRPEKSRALPPFEVKNASQLAGLVERAGVGQVLDLSGLGTIDCIEAVDGLGASFLSTSLERWRHEMRAPAHDLVRELDSYRRRREFRQAHIVGSGMNPGLVNALASAAIARFARLAGVSASPRALDLYALYVTEIDSTVAPDPIDTDQFACTWAPRNCLAELLEREAVVMRSGRPVGLGHAPTAALYRIRCGAARISGMVVPHDEVASLGSRFPTLETAFLYRPPPAACAALAAHPERRRPDEWKTRKLYPPFAQGLLGRDRVGVLLCSRRFGELWMGWATDARFAVRFGTNATEFQVAAGVLAGWSQLAGPPGVRFVEELDVRRCIADASLLLGEPEVHLDPAAPPLPLAARRVMANRVIRGAIDRPGPRPT